MQPVIEIRVREFDETLRRYAEVSRKTFTQIVANKAAQLAGAYGDGAIQNTAKADRERILRTLTRSVRSAFQYRKSGELRRHKSGRIITKLEQVHLDDGKTSLAARIVNARRVKRGLDPVWGDELDAEATRLVNRRLSAVAFIRSGWLWVIDDLRRFIDSAPRPGVSRSEKRSERMGHGKLIEATLTKNPVAEITSTSVNARSWTEEQKRSAARIAEAGLSRAFARVTADMRAYIERKMQKSLDGIK